MRTCALIYPLHLELETASPFLNQIRLTPVIDFNTITTYKFRH